MGLLTEGPHPRSALGTLGRTWESGHLPHPIRLTAVLPADKGWKGIRGNYQASSLFQDLMGLATVIVPACIELLPPGLAGCGHLRAHTLTCPPAHFIEWQLECLGALGEFHVVQ